MLRWVEAVVETEGQRRERGGTGGTGIDGRRRRCRRRRPAPLAGSTRGVIGAVLRQIPTAMTT